MIVLLVMAAGLVACDAEGAAERTSPQMLDIADFRQTFTGDFESLDISASGPDTRWTAHTPWHGDFGDAAFADPLPGFPFASAGPILRIEARRIGGRWQSGLISSRNHDGPGGSGFAQTYGYFEMDAKLPPGPGVWPGFWLVGITPAPRAEIDVVEYYGNEPGAYHANVHVWAEDDRKFGDGKVVAIPPGSASDRFNRYGVLVEADWVTFYFNRTQVWRTPTRPQFRQPLYILANLALGSGWPIDKTPDPSFLYIRSIAAYQRILH